MLKKTFMIACLLCVALVVNARLVDVDRQTAYNAVLQYRQATNTVNDTADYYSATVKNYINDDYCRVDTASANSHFWLKSNDDKWLIFVDEEPERLWAHKCTYYYLPKKVESIENIPLFSTIGYLKPLGVVIEPLHLIQKAPIQSSNDFVKTIIKKFTNISPLEVNPIANKNKVIIISGSPEDERDEDITLVNSINLFNVLTKKYLIPKDNIHLLINGYKNDFFDGVTLPPFNTKDIDNDGVDENIRTATLSELESTIQQISQENQDHLFIFFIGASGKFHDYDTIIGLPNEIEIFLRDQKSLDFRKMNSFLNQLSQTKFINLLFACKEAGFFVPILSAPNRIITTSTPEGDQTYISSFDNRYKNQLFANNWITALGGYCADSLYLNYYGIESVSNNADIDNNKILSMKELFDRCESLTTSIVQPLFSSTSQYLGEDLAFNRIPEMTDAFVKDNLEDTGKEYNISKEITWDSPEIWVRSTDDGVEHNESEPIDVNKIKKAYIYVKVHNRGLKQTGQGKDVFANLYWKMNTLGLKRGDIFSGTPKRGGKIGTAFADFPIQPGDSTILRYVWTIPDAILPLVAPKGTLSVRILVSLNSENENSIPKSGEPVYEKKYNNVALSDKTIINTAFGENITEYTTPNFDPTQAVGNFQIPITKKVVTIPVYIENPRSSTAKYSIEVLSDSVSDLQNAFNFYSIRMKMTPSFFDIWKAGGLQAESVAFTKDSCDLQLKSSSSKIKNLELAPNQIYKLELKIDNKGMSSFIDRTHYFHLVMRDQDNRIVDGMTFLAKFDGNGSGTFNPGITIEPGINGNVVLGASNINEPTQNRWYDQQSNLIGEGEHLVLPRTQAQGDYLLHSVSEISGENAFAVTHIDQQPAISQVYPCPFIDQLTVKIAYPAPSGTSIQVRSAQNTSVFQEKAVEVGKEEVVFSTEAFPSGIYIVSLFVDGTLCGSVQVVK